MENTLTAKALAELYAPLWELVPETKPVVDDRYGCPLCGYDALYSSIAGGHMKDDKCTQPAGDDWTGTPVFAALCRVAVEDWLFLNFKISVYAPAFGRNGVTNDFDVYVREVRDEDVHPYKDGEYIEEGNLPCWSGPTIHHALVAAALAVAKVKA